MGKKFKVERPNFRQATNFALKTQELTLSNNETVQLTLNHALLLQLQHIFPEQVAVANRTMMPTRKSQMPGISDVYTTLYVAHLCYCMYSGEDAYEEDDFYMLAGDDMMAVTTAFKNLFDPNQRAAGAKRG